MSKPPVASWRVFRLPLALAAARTADYAMHIQKQLSSAMHEAFAALPSDAALLISELGIDYFLVANWTPLKTAGFWAGDAHCDPGGMGDRQCRDNRVFLTARSG